MGPGGMVGRGLEMLPGGNRATGWDGSGGLADLAPVRVLGVAGPVAFLGQQARSGGGREGHDHGVADEPAEVVEDVVRHLDHEHSHVITGQS